jgi:2-polyprenyl-3-methyl-5-hydroxy-6-metoxy-1,4-benzoquinol methylase
MSDFPLCPLCQSSKIFKIKSIEIANLRNKWLNNFGFDPFVDIVNQEKYIINYQCGNCDLEFFHPAWPGNSQFYEKLSTNNNWYYEENKWEFQEAISRISANSSIKTILEIGCGQGFFLEKIPCCYNILGLEINQNAISICRKKGLNVLDKPLKKINAKFDLIVSFEVLEHISNVQEFITQAIDLIAPGGSIILAVPNPQSYFQDLDCILLDLPPHHLTKWSTKTFEYLSSKFELEIIDIVKEPLRFKHYEYYIHMLNEQEKYLDFQNIFQKIKNKIRQQTINLSRTILLPYTYNYHKNMLSGQTHLVEFKKK